VALPFNIQDFTGTIASGTALSAAISTGAHTLCGIIMPGAWTAAPLTFQVSPDGGTTWLELYDDTGNAVTIPAAANQFILLQSLPNYLWRGVNQVKVRSGTAAAPVNQVASAVITLRGRPETE
jgi:hypothetical protein